MGHCHGCGLLSNNRKVADLFQVFLSSCRWSRYIILDGMPSSVLPNCLSEQLKGSVQRKAIMMPLRFYYSTLSSGYSLGYHNAILWHPRARIQDIIKIMCTHLNILQTAVLSCSTWSPLSKEPFSLNFHGPLEIEFVDSAVVSYVDAIRDGTSKMDLI
jgi:hypothetical protein